MDGIKLFLFFLFIVFFFTYVSLALVVHHTHRESAKVIILSIFVSILGIILGFLFMGDLSIFYVLSFLLAYVPLALLIHHPHRESAKVIILSILGIIFLLLIYNLFIFYYFLTFLFAYVSFAFLVLPP